FSYGCKRGKAQRYKVPKDVDQLRVIVSGAAGATPFGGGAGGAGARVVATVPVTPGSKYDVLAGCQGQRDGGGGAGLRSGDTGAVGVASGIGGGGGGSSALVKDDGTPLIIASGGAGGDDLNGGAGGGGGGGGVSLCDAALNCDPVVDGANQGNGSV